MQRKLHRSSFFFSVCSSNTYGVNCAENCDCMDSHTNDTTQTCDALTGACNCQAGWNGTRCETDIDECAGNTHGCHSQQNEGCHNLEGSYNCSCFLGYQRDNSGNCVESKFLTHYRLNKLSYTIYWKSLIMILGMSCYMIQVLLKKNG